MWDKLKGLVGKSPPKPSSTVENLLDVDWTTSEVRQFLSSTGRVPFDLVKRAAQELSESAFSHFVTCPVLAGSAVVPGTMVPAEDPTINTRRRKGTLLFRPKDILSPPSAESEPLQKALYPLVKESTSMGSGANEFTIGRLVGNDLVIPDFAVSEKHAHIELKNGHYHITDVGSTNGTKIKGMKIFSPYKLKDEDIISFGRFDFHFLYPASLYWMLRS